MKRFCSVCLVMFVALVVSAQKIDSHIGKMGEALVPYGKITATNCHSVEIELDGPWGYYALPDGVNPIRQDEYTWTIIQANLLRVNFDLAKLDEDKVLNDPVFSLDYIRKHEKGTRYVADRPTVMLRTSGVNDRILAHKVDLKKLEAISAKGGVTEAQMGVTVAESKGATILFLDKEHADAFEKAVKKAIVVCRAQ